MRRLKLLCVALGLSLGTGTLSAEPYDDAYQLGAYNQAFNALNAESGKDALANYYLGRMYLYGYGLLRNQKLALSFFQKAATQGYLPAQFFLGKYALHVEKDPKEALKWFEQAARQGDLAAQLYVSAAYLYGFGTRVNSDIARRYFIDASKAGNPIAQFELAQYFLSSRQGSSQRLGLIWLEKAADTGQNPSAQARLGEIYLEGKIASRNVDEAKKWLTLAANKKNASGILGLGRLAESQTELSLAEKYYQEASALGSIDARLALANLYLNEKGALFNARSGFELIKQAADAGNVKAAETLAVLYQKGTGTEANEKLAAEWKTKAQSAQKAKQTAPDARTSVALWLTNGEFNQLDAIQIYSLTGILSPWTNAETLASNVYNAAPEYQLFSKQSFFKPNFELVTPNAIPLNVYYDTLIKTDYIKHRQSWRYPVYPLSRHLESEVVANSSVLRLQDNPLPYRSIYALSTDSDKKSLFKRFFLPKTSEQNYLLIFNEMYNQAILGNAEAQFNIGQMFHYGLGVTQNDVMAVNFYSKAAEQQHLPAQYEMALIYLSKKDDPESYITGFKYLSDAAFKGNAYAEYAMSKLLEDNGQVPRIVNPDNEQALSMLYLSAANGFGQAQYELAEKLLHEKNTSLSVSSQAHLHKEIRRLYESAAKQGVSASLLPLAFFNAMEASPDAQKRAFAMAKEKAELGSRRAALLLGLLYDRGIGVTVDSSKAMEWYQKAGKNIVSRFILGTYMLEGKEITQNKKEGEALLKQSGEAGFSYSDLNLAILSAQQNETFLPDLVKAYQQGNSTAGLLLADYTLAHAASAESLSQAREIYQGLAEQGDQNAQLKLAYIYEQGIGLPIDLTQAFHWYEASANQGNPYAQYQLAAFYQAGKIDAPKPDLALLWYAKAATKLAKAAVAAGFVEETVFDNNQKAFEAYTAAAKKGDTDAKYNLGLIYEYGKGQPVNYALAKEQYQQAADKGHANARACLASMYFKGRGVSKDLDLAVNLYQQAAKVGNAQALYELGMMHEAGVGVGQDYQQALIDYQGAVQRGNEKAMIALARLYQYGIGTAKNEAEALKLYEELVKRHNAYAAVQLAKYYLENPADQSKQGYVKELLQSASENGSQEAATLLRSIEAQTQKQLSFITPGIMYTHFTTQEKEADLLYFEAIRQWNSGDEQLSRLMLRKIVKEFPDFEPAQRLYKQVNPHMA